MHFKKRIKLLMIKRTKQAEENQKDSPNLDMAKVFSQCNLFPVPYGNCCTLISFFYGLQSQKDPSSVLDALFIVCVLPFTVLEIFLPWNILYLSGLKI